MTPDELDFRIQRVLQRLSLLAEGSTTNFDPKTSHGHSESRAPRGEVNLDGREPDRDRCSLYEFFGWHFAREGDHGKLEKLVQLAEYEWERQAMFDPNRAALRKGELTENDVRDGGLAEREAAQRVIDLYEGVPALRVALIENAREIWVIKARRLHKRNPEDGRRLPDFRGWDDERRAIEVRVCANTLGMSQQATADHFGVAKRTVQRYWPEPEARAA